MYLCHASHSRFFAWRTLGRVGSSCYLLFMVEEKLLSLLDPYLRNKTWNLPFHTWLLFVFTCFYKLLISFHGVSFFKRLLVMVEVGIDPWASLFRVTHTCLLGCACLEWAAMSPMSKPSHGKFSVMTAMCTASPSASSTGHSCDRLQSPWALSSLYFCVLCRRGW